MTAVTPQARPSARALERAAWPLFGAASAVGAALSLWFGRGSTFSTDEVAMFMLSADFDLGEAVDAYNGHFVLLIRLYYRAAFDLFGTDYLAFRVMTSALVVLAAALTFVYLSRRVGKLVAFAPTLVLLVFGSDFVHVIKGNGFGLLLTLALGVAALLALEREDRTGDVACCALLSVAVATYTVALGFVAGAAMWVLLRDNRWRRVWIPVVPTAIYAIWWLSTQGSEASPENQVTLSNLLLVPAWGFQSLGVVVGAITGLNYDFGLSGDFWAGPTFAVAALALLIWRLRRGSIPKGFWMALAILVTLWTLGALAAGLVRLPSDPRYLYPGTLATLLLLGWAAANIVWRKPAIIALYVIAAIGVLTNIAQLRDGGFQVRDEAVQTRLYLGVLELAGDRISPDFDRDVIEAFTVYFALRITDDAEEEDAVTAYKASVQRYGAIGYSAQEISSLDESLRARADVASVAVEGVALAPGDLVGRTRDCLAVPADGSEFEIAPGGAVALEAVEGRGAVEVRRFAEVTRVVLGTTAPSRQVTLATPQDESAQPWVVRVPNAVVNACPES